MFTLCFILFLSYSRSVAQVTILFVNEEMCPGDNLTFSCQGAGGALVWTLTNLPGVTGVMDYFGRNLNMDPGAERITSTDTQSGSSPSTITILNAAVADNGAMVQCSTVPNGASAMITLSIRNQLNCSANVSVIDIGSFYVTLSWTPPMCSDVMPMHYLVQWAQASTSRFERSGVIPMNDNRYNISSLRANTAYDIFLVVVDECGSMTAGRQTARTLESIGMDPTFTPTSTSPTTCSAGCTPDIIAGVVVGSLFLSLVVAAVVIIVLAIKMFYKKKSIPASHNEKSVYYETVQSDNVQMQSSPAYQSVEQLN